MAYQILSFATSPFTQQRTYTILCDTTADLPATVDGYSVTQGFTAKIIEDGSTYIADTSGTWKKQPDGIQLDLTGYYTAAQTDSLLAGKQDTLSTSQQNVIDNILIPGRKLFIQGTDPAGVIPLHSTWINGKTIKEYVDEEDTPAVSIEQGSFETFSGAEIPSSTRVRTTMPSEISPPGTYTVDITGADDAVIYVYDEDQTYSEADSFIAWDSMPRTFTITSPFYIRYAFRHSDNSNIVPSDVSGLTVNFEGWK